MFFCILYCDPETALFISCTPLKIVLEAKSKENKCFVHPNFGPQFVPILHTQFLIASSATDCRRDTPYILTPPVWIYNKNNVFYE